MSILDEIIEEKRRELALLLVEQPLQQLKELAMGRYEPRGFAKALRQSVDAAIIAEYKRGSPSRGMFQKSLDPVSTALAFARAGASSISVLTDAKFFFGSLAFVPLIRDHLKKAGFETPLLRKDFIIDPLQVWQTRAIGADAMLLILAALDDEQFSSLLRTGLEVELDILVEVHNSEELHRAIRCIEKEYPGENSSSEILLGINNRDLNTFVTDLSVTETLAAEAIKLLGASDSALGQIQLISESGIFTRADIDRLLACNVNGFLVGEALIAKGDPGENLQQLLGAS